MFQKCSGEEKYLLCSKKKKKRKYKQDTLLGRERILGKSSYELHLNTQRLRKIIMIIASYIWLSGSQCQSFRGSSIGQMWEETPECEGRRQGASHAEESGGKEQR